VVKKLYLDGCSMVYGQGLPRNQSLGSLFETFGGYEVLDNSRPGKSNLAISFDTYKNFVNFDIIVLGFTFSSRFGIKYRDKDLDFFVGHVGKEFGLDLADLDKAHSEVYKYFYTVFEYPYCAELSDMLVDSTHSLVESCGKKIVAFSWEPRNAKSQIYYPYVSPADRLNDGHLNHCGMKKLYDFVQNILAE